MNYEKALKAFNVSEITDINEIKKIYHKLVLKYHPDKNEGFEDKFKLISSAWEFINNNYPQHNPTVDLKCDICNMCFTSEQNQTDHLNGKKHKQMLNKNNRTVDFKCDICNICFTGVQQRKEHLIGKIHFKNINKTKEVPCCNICNLNFTSVDQKKSHLNGKLHHKNMLK